jgi:hypothetical protein
VNVNSKEKNDMTPRVPASFKFPAEFNDLLDRLARVTGTTKTGVLEDGARLAEMLLAAASRRAHSDLRTIIERYGPDARIAITVEKDDGLPVGKLVINAQPVEDVRARPHLDRDAGEVHIFLEVLVDERPDRQLLATIGDEPLSIRFPRSPVGSLPWPPKPNLGIVIDLADLPKLDESDLADVSALN